MGSIDDFLAATVAPHLWPGEAFQIAAHGRVPSNFNALGVPQRNEHMLLAATNLRLFLFKARAGGLMWENAPKPDATTPEILCFDELAAVESKVTHYGQIVPGGPPKMVVFVPVPMGGPRKGERIRFDVYGVAEGLDQQARFVAQFPEWLAGQIAAGAYPMSPEKRAHLEQAAAQHAEEQRKAAELAAQRAAELRKKLGPAVLWFLWLVALGGLGLSTFVGQHDFFRFKRNQDQALEKVADYERRNAALKKETKALEAGDMPYECSGKATCGPCDHGEAWEKNKKPGHTAKGDGWYVIKHEGQKWTCPHPYLYDLDFEKKSAEEYSGKSMLGLAQLVGSFVGFSAWIALAVGLRRRAAKKAALVPVPAPA